MGGRGGEFLQQQGDVPEWGGLARGVAVVVAKGEALYLNGKVVVVLGGEEWPCRNNVHFFWWPNYFVVNLYGE